jgi:hypothetical protein
MSQPFDVWMAALMREFSDAVNTFKTLPALPATNDVFHHINPLPHVGRPFWIYTSKNAKYSKSA